jgi:4-hydroxy-2-oxoheptanedioate aldolase
MDIRSPNPVRQKLAAGQCVTGAAVFSWSPYIIDAAGYAGFDYLRIDTEHVWRQDSMLEHLVRAAHLGGVVPIVRIDRDNPYLARKALEIGAGGIIVPDVSTVAEAEAVVRAAKFPPRGERGFSNYCFSAGWGAEGAAEWVTWSDREALVGIMIENVEAMQRIDDIMAVDGIDFALFGPADFSMSLGLGAPKAQDERVQAAIAETVVAAHKAGKYVSLGVGTEAANIEKYLALGIDMLELGADLQIVSAGWAWATAAVSEILAGKD